MAGLHCYLGPCLSQCWPMLTSMAPVTIEGHMDACGLGCHWFHVDVQGPCCYWGHINLSALVLPPDTMTSGPELQLRAMSWFMQQGSVFMSVACFTTGSYGTACPGGLDTRELVLPISHWLPQLNWSQWHRCTRADPNSRLSWANWPPHLLAAAIGELVPLGVRGGWPYLLPCVWENWLGP